MSINSDFEDLLCEFCAAGVRFLVVGGYAFTFHATPRYTKDIDLWIEASPRNARHVWAALSKFGAPLGALTQADFEQPGIFVTFGKEPARVDVLTSVSGVEFAEAWARRSTMSYGRVAAVPVLSERDLVASKRAAGRLKDLADVEELERRAKLRGGESEGDGQVAERPPARRRAQSATARRRRRS